MSNLTGLQNGVFNSLQLIDDTTGDSTEVRQLFLQGSLEQSIPNNPQNNQVLSIPGLLPELNARQLISNSYSKTEVNSLIQNNPGPKGAKGDQGVGTKGSKGLKGDTGPSSTGTKGQKGEQGSLGQKGEAGGLGSKGQKGSQGTQGSGSKGDKGEPGAAPNTSLFRLISDSYSRADIDTWIASSTSSINTNAQNIISNQIDISMLQIADNGLQSQITNNYQTFTSTINAIQTQLNYLTNEVSNRPNLDVIVSGSTYTPYRLVVQGSGVYQASWAPTSKELVLTFQ